MKDKYYAFPSDGFDSGMLLRDYFANAAMQGFCANPDYDGIDHKDLAIWSYEVADAMLEARK
jgi:hypothetical protein